ncbi:transglycosylase SLT domain-containing protein [Sphingomonas sp. TDK1]|uniref:transglycosylase SLT domain-containing protein n=1 Tax=Sphingomonas sp. TDK1 TaxID=453247 RepID=UPI0007D9331C|nr:transglycosylase SLT domain-containing protein [Sphingomonas sp. TDK1]OAN58880.1 hypothetical protein A7X12_04370 [Sphingomonas sp. TDK1]
MPPELPPLTRNYRLAAPMMRGDEIARAQALLKPTSSGIKVDGIFGLATHGAVLQFQKSKGLTSDGVIGGQTWRALHGTSAGDALETEADQILSDTQRARLGAFHARFAGGYSWRITDKGLEIEGLGVPMLGRAEAARILDNFAQQIASASAVYKVPIELVVATILAESSGRPAARRLEPGCDHRNPERTPTRVSVGLTQTLLSTARSALRQPGLTLADLENPATSISAGMAYMWSQARETGFDPPLVAAAYNAGSVRYNGGAENRWRLRQFPIGTGKHCDRFVRFFNACWADPRVAQVPKPGFSYRTLLG